MLSFCDNFDNLVKNHKPESYLTVKSSTLCRQSYITTKLVSMHYSNTIQQKFSWHRMFSIYVSRKKLMKSQHVVLRILLLVLN